jgi:hypothetical protein
LENFHRKKYFFFISFLQFQFFLSKKNHKNHRFSSLIPLIFGCTIIDSRFNDYLRWIGPLKVGFFWVFMKWKKLFNFSQRRYKINHEPSCTTSNTILRRIFQFIWWYTQKMWESIGKWQNAPSLYKGWPIMFLNR